MILLVMIALFLMFFAVKSYRNNDGTENSQKQSNMYFLGALFTIVLIIIEFFVENKSSNNEKIRQNNDYKDSYRNDYRDSYRNDYRNTYRNNNDRTTTRYCGDYDATYYENSDYDSDGDSSGD